MTTKELISRINKLPDHIIIHIYEYCQIEQPKNNIWVKDTKHYYRLFRKVFLIFIILLFIYGIIFGLGFIITREYSGVFVILNIFLGSLTLGVIIFCFGVCTGFKSFEKIINRLDNIINSHNVIISA